MTITKLRPAVYNLRQAIKAGKNKALGLVDDVAGTATKPQITIKKKPEVTIKSVTPANSGQVSGAEILAMQNKATQVNSNNTTRRADDIRTSIPKQNGQLSIKSKELPESDKCFKTFYDLCERNNGEIIPEDIVKLQEEFFKETGLMLHCSGNVREFNIMLGTIVDEIRAKRFPKEIKHIMIGHGFGNVHTKTWATADGPIFKFISKNNKIKEGDLILVGCCEERGPRILGKPAYGREVELDLDVVHTNRGPGKIVRAGEEDLCGHYSLADGLKLYED